MDASAEAPAPTPPPPRRRWLRRLALALLAVVLLVVLLPVAVWLSLRTEVGTRFWVGQAAGRAACVQLGVVQGALLGTRGDLALDQLVIDCDGLRIRIDGLSWSGLRLGGFGRSAPFVNVHLDTLRARSVDIVPPPAKDDARRTPPPRSLRLPLEATVKSLEVGRLTVAGLPYPVEQLRAGLALGAVHRVDALSLRWRGLALAGQARIGADAPLPLATALSLRAGEPIDGAVALLPPWAKGLAVDVQAEGPLAEFEGRTAIALEGQRLDANARVRPFDPLPVARLDAQLQQLNLQPLARLLDADAPETRLSGSVALELDRDPLALQARLRNELPGRWDQGRLPVATLEVDGGGNRSRIDLERVEATLAGAPNAPAGRLRAEGEVLLPPAATDDNATRPWPGGDLRLQLDALNLPLLDKRAPPLQLGGPLRLRHAPPAARAPDRQLGTATIDARLNGSLVGAAAPRAPAALRGAPVRVEALAEWQPAQIRIERLLADSGAGRLEGQALLRAQGSRWSGDGRATLQDFDPSLWLPGTPDATWRKASNDLDGELQFRGSAATPGKNLAAWLAVLEGSAQARIAEGSQLGGVAVKADAQAQADGRGLLSAQTAASLGANRVDAQLRLRPLASTAGAGDDERLQLKIDAPQLGSSGALGRAYGLAGSARAQVDASGPLGAWLLTQPGRGARPGAPLQSQGRVELDAVRSKALGVQQLRARWDATLPPGDATDVKALERARVVAELRAERLDLPGTVIPAVALKAGGTLGQHGMALRAVLAPAPPPDSSEPPGRPLVLDTALRGRWSADGDGAQRWQIEMPRLLVQVLSRVEQADIIKPLLPAAASAEMDDRPPELPALPPPRYARSPLLLARDLRGQLQRDAKALRWQVEPARMEVSGAGLSWSTLQGEQRSGQAPLFDVVAALEPLQVSELLRRLQPEFGWTGDLQVGGRLEMHARPEVSLQLELARVGGDLEIGEPGGVRQPLGIDELRLAASADRGRWNAQARLNGSNLGRVELDLVADASPQDLLPGPQARVDGRLLAKVENLGAWAVWVPAGWRLGGRLDAELAISGSRNAPRLNGTVEGRELALRNALQGVDLRDGALDLLFDGEVALLRTLRFAAGDGTLEATGNARLGAAPEATLDFAARKATVLGRVDRRVVVSGDAQLRLKPDLLALKGKIGVDEGLVDISRLGAPGLGDDVVVKRPGEEIDENALEPPASRRNIDLDLTLDAGQRLALRGHGLDTRLEGQLRITSPKGRLRGDGEIRTVGGRFEAYGQRLVIDRGVVSFSGDIANPLLDIQAVRPNLDVSVGVRISGNVNAPRLRLFSDPEMPDSDKLAYLVTGRPADSLGGTDVLMLQRAALALLAGEQGAGGVFRTLGFDNFSVSQSDGATRDTIVTLGRQISDRVYVGYRRGIEAATGTWEITYRIAQRFTLRAQSGEESALDLIWIFRWD